MAWAPHIYEDRPVLRERVLAAAAIATVFIGGAMAMNTIVTGGWQWGVASTSSHQIYLDDVNQQWSEPAPGAPVSQPVSLANAAFEGANLQSPQDGGGAEAHSGNTQSASLTSYAAASSSTASSTNASSALGSSTIEIEPPAVAPSGLASSGDIASDAAPVDEEISQMRFDQIEADMAEAGSETANVAADDDGGPKN